MILLSSIVPLFEAELLAPYRHSLLPSHLKALAAMKTGRTSASPSMLAPCTECDHRVLVPHSCGHRRCPHGQHHESQPWLERPLQKRVPGTYFLLTFTLPAELSALAFGQQRTLYTLLIQCAWQGIQSFAQNDKQWQGTPGAIAVLHTHSRALDDHPHAHWVVPAAAIDAEKRRWRTKKGKKDYLFNHKALAKVFRAKRLAAIAAEGLAWPARGPEQGVVDGQGVGSGAKALGYLGRYLYRGVIREKDILSGENGPVTFRYKNAKTPHTETRTVSGARFLWLILPHVLPKGFRRARHFGFRHPNRKRLLAWLQYLRGLDSKPALAWIKPRPRLSCPCCGGDMKMIKTRLSPSLSGPPPVPIGDRAGASVMSPPSPIRGRGHRSSWAESGVRLDDPQNRRIIASFRLLLPPWQRERLPSKIDRSRPVYDPSLLPRDIF